MLNITQYYCQFRDKYESHLSTLSPKERKEKLAEAQAMVDELNQQWNNRDSVVASISYIKEFASTSLTEADQKERDRNKKKTKHRQ